MRQGGDFAEGVSGGPGDGGGVEDRVYDQAQIDRQRAGDSLGDTSEKGREGGDRDPSDAHAFLPAGQDLIDGLLRVPGGDSGEKWHFAGCLSEPSKIYPDPKALSHVEPGALEGAIGGCPKCRGGQAV